MDANQEVGAESSEGLSIRVLSNPYLDRAIAVVATLPFLWLAYYRYQGMKLGLPLLSFSSGVLILFVTMIFRRPPTRVTPNPVYWLLAFVATYWPVVTVGLIEKGSPVAPDWVTRSRRVIESRNYSVGASELGTKHWVCARSAAHCHHWRVLLHAVTPFTRACFWATWR